MLLLTQIPFGATHPWCDEQVTTHTRKLVNRFSTMKDDIKRQSKFKAVNDEVEEGGLAKRRRPQQQHQQQEHHQETRQLTRWKPPQRHNEMDRILTLKSSQRDSHVRVKHKSSSHKEIADSQLKTHHTLCLKATVYSKHNQGRLSIKIKHQYLQLMKTINRNPSEFKCVYLKCIKTNKFQKANKSEKCTRSWN